MVMPRILDIGTDGFLRQEPATEFEKLRGEPVSLQSTELALGAALPIKEIRGDSLEIEAEFVMGGAGEVGFDLRRAEDGRPGVTVRITRNGSLTVGSVRAAISRSMERYRVRVFLDKRVIEVYVNDGEAALYSTVDAGAQDLGIAVVANAPAGRGFGGGPAPAAGAGRAGQPGGPPTGGGRGAAPTGPVRLHSLRAWTMKPAEFSLARFKS